ncbi:hypothetical protein [Hydrocarboniclastica marina]|uniref:Phosphoadenosine phosphosulphate reductase domain-containing protein n=1 Tax=Hydrocarboniclastica marina TaxID=2259620 RepID=A0A4P7XMR6_9ALTE|nr:hypothetical protein [Hydrocarboniclastica marina]QCF28054.1 hypothetical protein soil367_18445 [Hydrocarboniclastica marina]
MSVQIFNSRFEGIRAKAEMVISHLIGLLDSGYSLCCASSMGKDSSAVLVLMFEAMLRAKSNGTQLPQCFLSHSNSGLENPAMDSYTGEMLLAAESFVEQHGLPLRILSVEPALASSFFYATIGRGKLPIFVDSKHRQCSVDWKVRPQHKALRLIRKQLPKEQQLVILVGTRESESAARGERMRAAGHKAHSLVQTDDEGVFTNACIADWEMTDVWNLLLSCDRSRQGIYQTFVKNFNHTLDLYKAANEGTCVIVSGDGGNRAACGARQGCGICPVTGDRDKSMEAMIASEPSRFGYLEGINKLRNFIVRTQHDLSRRDWLQKSLSPIGYVSLSPDGYSAWMRRDILRYMITLDVLEEERAEEHAAAICRGEVEPTVENRRLAHPQFQWITPRNLVAIDFAWGVHACFDHAFPALREWYEIRELGRRYFVPEVSKTDFPPKKIPEKRFFYVGQYGHAWKLDGLRNHFAEAINPYRRPGKPGFGAYVDSDSGETRRVTYFEESDELTIDGATANSFVLEFEDLFYEIDGLDVQQGVTYLLDRGIVKVGRGQIGNYDRIARRSQFWKRLQRQENVADVQKFVLENSIPSSEHTKLMEQARQEQEVQREQNFDLFESELAA